MKAKHEPRQDTRRQRKQISTYPSDGAWELLGGGASTVATAAAECWAQAMGEATLENELALAPAHWAALADWLGGRNVHDLVPHSVRAPGVMLAAALRDAWMGRHEEALGGAAEQAAKLVCNMDYLHVWAVLWALDWQDRAGRGADAEWWTLAARLH
jgi:hypothetical protein